MDDDDTAIWSLLIASGYLKVLTYEKQTATGFGRERMYDLCLTNGEVVDMFYSMVRGWFRPAKSNYSDFVSALLCGDVETMNVYEEKQYEAVLAAKGIPKERIRKYGFAFEGKKVLIG